MITIPLNLYIASVKPSGPLHHYSVDEAREKIEEDTRTPYRHIKKAVQNGNFRVLVRP